jgi:uncharacterized protein
MKEETMNPGSLIVLTLSLALATGCASMSQGPVGPDKVVYHINDSQAQAVAALRNIGNHLEVNPKAKIVVVSHAQGVDFLFEEAKDKNGNPYNIKVEQLKEQGVKFDVCEITVRNRKIDRKKFLQEATFVPSGVAEITRLQQREGYAYLRP